MNTAIHTVKSSDFKKDFGRVLDEVQHQNIVITKHGRSVATMISQRKLDKMKTLLAGYPLALFESGKLDILEALSFQMRILADVDEAKKQYESGETKSLDDVFANFL